jgi:hypothetical protein
MVKWVFKDCAVNGVNWVLLHHYKALWQAFVNTIMNLRISYMWGFPEELRYHPLLKKRFASCSLLSIDFLVPGAHRKIVDVLLWT